MRLDGPQKRVKTRPSSFELVGDGDRAGNGRLERRMARVRARLERQSDVGSRQQLEVFVPVEGAHASKDDTAGEREIGVMLARGDEFDVLGPCAETQCGEAIARMRSLPPSTSALAEDWPISTRSMRPPMRSAMAAVVAR